MRILTFSIVLGACCWLVGCSLNSKSTTYSIKDKVREIRLTSVNATICPVSKRLSRSKIDNGEADPLGRTYQVVPSNELGEFKAPSFEIKPIQISAIRNTYFDLWTVIDALQKDPQEVAVRVSFTVETEKDTTAYMGLGGNDGAAVFINGNPCFAVLGGRDQRLTQNLITLPLKRGKNEVVILSQRAEAWTSVPQFHLAKEWSLCLQIFENHEIAWDTYKNRIWHPFDTPIISNVNQLRPDSYWENGTRVEIRDMSGAMVALGEIENQATIRWKNANDAAQTEGIAIACIGNKISEPVIITGRHSLEEVFASQNYQGKLAEENPWYIRACHLLDFQFKDSRDIWWARKFAVTLAQLKLEEEGKDRKELLENCQCLRLLFGHYRSSIDKTTQYFRYVRSLKNRSEARVVAIMPPTVPSPVRPFLESYTIADINSSENIASVADSLGIDLIWTGGVSVDYGGELSRRDLYEGYEAYRRLFPPSDLDQTFLVGICSSGVTALGNDPHSLKADGVVLWSPQVRRQYYRWTPGLEPSGGMLPDSVLELEQTNNNLERFRDLPIFVYYDNDAEGHGDRAATGKLIENVQKMGGHISSDWLNPPDPNLPWGVRSILSEEVWLEWIAKQARSAKKAEFYAKDTIAIPPRTVKEALLRGFSVRSDASSSYFMTQWIKIVSRYRGGNNIPLSEDSSYTTQILLKTIDIRLKENFLKGKEMPGYPQIKDTISEGNTDRKVGILWGFRMVLDKVEPPRIELLSETDQEMPNEIDLFIDGCCQAALWEKTPTGWKLYQVWL